MSGPGKPTFFATPAEWRAWLEVNHATVPELLVGFYKKDSGKPTIDWPQSVDQALCFGWIDGIRRGIDGESYSIRFTPRRAGSVWSNINMARVRDLIKTKQMRPAGLTAYAARKENRSGIYSYEQRTAELPAPYSRILKRNKRAWNFFHAQPPWYRKTIHWWVVSAKKEETRQKRLAMLVDLCAREKWLPGLERRPGR